MKVLVVEDVPADVEAIRVCFTIRWPDATLISTDNGSDALALVESVAPDIVTLDLSLPDMPGLDVLREIRRFSDLPIIIVTAKSDETVKVTGLEMGADDFIEKPFSHTELMARTKAVLRRTCMPELRGDEGVVSYQGLSIDLAAHRILLDGTEVDLTPTEWHLLSYMVRNRGKVVTHRVLAEKVWGTEFLNGATIKMCVRRLRLKLGEHSPAPSIIRTHRGMGYSFAMPR